MEAQVMSNNIIASIPTKPLEVREVPEPIVSEEQEEQDSSMPCAMWGTMCHFL